MNRKRPLTHRPFQKLAKVIPLPLPAGPRLLATWDEFNRVVFGDDGPGEVLPFRRRSTSKEIQAVRLQEERRGKYR